MTKRNFIELADLIKQYKNRDRQSRFTNAQILVLADFCASQNPNFNRDRWIRYIEGACGPNGGKP